VKQCVEFYYIWKKVCEDEYKMLCQARKQHLNAQLNASCSSADGNNVRIEGTLSLEHTWSCSIAAAACALSLPDQVSFQAGCSQLCASVIKQYNFGTDHRVVMLCGWRGKLQVWR